MFRLALFVYGLCLSLPVLALQCVPESPEVVVAAKADSAREVLLFDCPLSNEQALSLRGELASTLVRAHGYLKVVFTGKGGSTVSDFRRGSWLGRFNGLKLNKTLPVPPNSNRVRILVGAESSRLDTVGELQLKSASIGAGLLATLISSDNSVVELGKTARWVVQTGKNSPNANAYFELLDLEGGVLEQASFSLPTGGGRAEVSWSDLPVGYYDVRAVISASGMRNTILHSAFAVVPHAVVPNERRFGIDAALSWYGGSPEQVARSVSMMRQAGIGTVRDRLSWSRVQPLAGKTRWGRYAEVAATVAEAELDAVQVFHDSPAWARGNSKYPGDRQPAIDDAAIYAFGRAYASGLGQTVRNIEYWNEPNSAFFKGYPYQYASGLKAFSAGVKSVDPDIRVLIGAAAGRPGRFFEEIYRNNVDGFFDIRNQHYYGKDADIADFVATQVADREQRFGIASQPGWLTEMGYSLSRDARGDWRKTEIEQAEYLVKTYVSGFAAGYERVFFFFWRELVAHELHTWGIVRGDFTPRPAYVALSVLTRYLAGSVLVATETHAEGMTIYFRQPTGKYSAVSWGSGIDVARFGNTLAAKDIYGRPLDVQKGLPINGKPVLLSGITGLPNNAKLIMPRSMKPLPEAELRMSIGLSVAEKSVAKAAANRVAVSVGDDENIVLSGRVFVPTVTKDSEPVSVQCVAGEGLRPLAPVLLTVTPQDRDGAPFMCSFIANLSMTGESYIGVRAKHLNSRDDARIALIPDVGHLKNGTVRTLVDSGVCMEWVAHASHRVEVNLNSRQLPDRDCPLIEVISYIASEGDAWVFPFVRVREVDWSNSIGVRIVVSKVDGIAPPPKSMLLQLVERSGGVWFVDLVPTDGQIDVLSGLFKLARPALSAPDDNGQLDLANVHEMRLGWGGYGGQVGQRHGFSIKDIKLLDAKANKP